MESVHWTKTLSLFAPAKSFIQAAVAVMIFVHVGQIRARIMPSARTLWIMTQSSLGANVSRFTMASIVNSSQTCVEISAAADKGFATKMTANLNVHALKIIRVPIVKQKISSLLPRLRYRRPRHTCPSQLFCLFLSWPLWWIWHILNK